LLKSIYTSQIKHIFVPILHINKGQTDRWLFTHEDTDLRIATIHWPVKICPTNGKPVNAGLKRQTANASKPEISKSFSG